MYIVQYVSLIELWLAGWIRCWFCDYLLAANCISGQYLEKQKRGKKELSKKLNVLWCFDAVSLVWYCCSAYPAH